jgi:hypothetical protein
MSRSLQKTAEFLSQVHKASQQTSRLLEAIAGAEWILTRQPEHGMAVRGTGFRSWPVHPAEGVTFKIIYSFDEREVVFRSLYTAVAPSGFGR